jgi:hypothetical protein
LGKVLITQAASAAIEAARMKGAPILYRHQHGDWGDITEKDALQNQQALLHGMRVWSSYRLATGKVIWVISEANRSITTILLADSIN